MIPQQQRGPERATAEELAVVQEAEPELVNLGNFANLNEASINEELDKIAMNLIFVMAQIPEIIPIDTTVQVSEPSTAFGYLLETRLVDAGYGLRRTTDQIGKFPVQYEFLNGGIDGVYHSKATLSIGKYEVQRLYNLTPESVTAASPLVLRGYDKNKLDLNDDLLSNDSSAGIVVKTALKEPVVDNDRDLANAIDAAVPLSQRLSSSNFGDLIKQNMYTTMQSNYMGFFKDFRDVSVTTLIFPNDSTRLSSENKSTIQRLIGEMDPNNDVISLVGCSHGKTSDQVDNEGLAIGRANVVKLELVSNGVAYDRVLDEGCWAKGYHDEFPTRGVVLTLKRLNS